MVTVTSNASSSESVTLLGNKEKEYQDLGLRTFVTESVSSIGIGPSDGSNPFVSELASSFGAGISLSGFGDCFPKKKLDILPSKDVFFSGVAAAASSDVTVELSAGVAGVAVGVAVDVSSAVTVELSAGIAGVAVGVADVSAAGLSSDVDVRAVDSLKFGEA